MPWSIIKKKGAEFQKKYKENLDLAWAALKRTVKDKLETTNGPVQKKIEERDYLKRLTRFKLTYLEKEKKINQLHALDVIAKVNRNYTKNFFPPINELLKRSLEDPEHVVVTNEHLRDLDSLGRLFLVTPGQTLSAGIQGIEIEQACLGLLLKRLKKDKEDDTGSMSVFDLMKEKDPRLLEIKLIEERLDRLQYQFKHTQLRQREYDLLRNDRLSLLWTQWTVNAFLWGAIISFLLFLITNPIILLVRFISKRPLTGEYKYPTRTIVFLILMGVFGVAGYLSQILMHLAESTGTSGYDDPVLGFNLTIGSFFEDPDCYMDYRWSLMTGMIVLISILQAPAWYFFAMRTRAHWLERVYRPRVVTWTAMLQIFAGIAAGVLLGSQGTLFRQNVGIFPILLYIVGPLSFFVLWGNYIVRGAFSFRGKENWRQLFRPFLRGLRKMFLTITAVALFWSCLMLPVLKTVQRGYLEKVSEYMEKQGSTLREPFVKKDIQKN